MHIATAYGLHHVGRRHGAMGCFEEEAVTDVGSTDRSLQCGVSAQMLLGRDARLETARCGITLQFCFEVGGVRVHPKAIEVTPHVVVVTQE